VPGISIHVVDVTRGVPAEGMRVDVHREEDSGRVEIGAGTIGADGVLAHPMNEGIGVATGPHVVAFHVGDYYRSHGVAIGNPAFLEVALFRFTVTDVTEHYHLPVKLSAWGLSIWRGR
jgi:5-hydroxyisourate hydrolase